MWTSDIQHILTWVTLIILFALFPLHFEPVLLFISFGITETVTATLLMDLYCYWVAACCIFISFYVALKLFRSPSSCKHNKDWSCFHLARWSIIKPWQHLIQDSAWGSFLADSACYADLLTTLPYWFTLVLYQCLIIMWYLACTILLTSDSIGLIDWSWLSKVWLLLGWCENLHPHHPVPDKIGHPCSTVITAELWGENMRGFMWKISQSSIVTI